MRDFRSLLAIAFVLMGCGKTKDPATDAGPTCTDGSCPSDASDASDGPGASDTADGPVDRYDEPTNWTASLACGSETCGAGGICVRWTGGVPDAGADFHCVAGCEANPTCSCVQRLMCSSFQCFEVGPRHISCGEGAAGGDFSFDGCSSAGRFPCFKGPPVSNCPSSPVDAICVNGTWVCAYGSVSADPCPSDGGAEAGGDGGGD